MPTPFGQMSDAEVEALARQLGVQMPGRAPLPAGDYFAGQSPQLVPLAPGGAPRVDPATIADLSRPPQPQPLGPAPVVGQGVFAPEPGAAKPGKPAPADAAEPRPGPVEQLGGQVPSSFAAAAPAFTPRFVQTGMPGIGQGVFANNRDEEIAALAQQTATRVAGNLGGTGFGASGDYFAPNGAAFTLHAAQLGQQAGSDVMRMLQATDATQEQARQAEANRQAEIQKAQIAGAAHVAGAQAAHSPDALRGLGNLKLLDMVAQGNVNPENLKLATQFLGSLHGATPAAGAAAPAGQDIMQQLQALKGGREQAIGAAGAFGTAGPNGFEQAKDIGPANADRFADSLMNSGPEQRRMVATAIREGKFGDPQAILSAIARAAAINNFKAQPPTGPNGQPIDFFGADRSGIPGTYGVTGENGRPVMSLGVKPSNPLVPNLRNFVAAGVPYNQVRLANGQVFDINPAELRSTFDKVMGRVPDRDTLANRAYQQNAILQLLQQAGVQPQGR